MLTSNTGSCLAVDFSQEAVPQNNDINELLNPDSKEAVQNRKAAISKAQNEFKTKKTYAEIRNQEISSAKLFNASLVMPKATSITASKASSQMVTASRKNAVDATVQKLAEKKLNLNTIKSSTYQETFFNTLKSMAGTSRAKLKLELEKREEMSVFDVGRDLLADAAEENSVLKQGGGVVRIYLLADAAEENNFGFEAGRGSGKNLSVGRCGRRK